jgi:hypothetical protein
MNKLLASRHRMQIPAGTGSRPVVRGHDANGEVFILVQLVILAEQLPSDMTETHVACQSFPQQLQDCYTTWRAVMVDEDKKKLRRVK